MTVAELRKYLADLPADAVCVWWPGVNEPADLETELQWNLAALNDEPTHRVVFRRSRAKVKA
jgi:hypothetical protein